MRFFKFVIVMILFLFVLIWALIQGFNHSNDRSGDYDCEPVKLMSIDILNEFLVLKLRNGEEIRKNYNKKDVIGIERFINQKPSLSQPYIFLCGHSHEQAKIIWPDTTMIEI